MAIIGIVAVVTGYFSAREWFVIVALLIVAAINWRRARKADKDPHDQSAS